MYLFSSPSPGEKSWASMGGAGSECSLGRGMRPVTVHFSGTRSSEVASLEHDASGQLAKYRWPYLPRFQEPGIVCGNGGTPSFLLSRLSNPGQAMEE